MTLDECLQQLVVLKYNCDLWKNLAIRLDRLLAYAKLKNKPPEKLLNEVKTLRKALRE